MYILVSIKMCLRLFLSEFKILYESKQTKKGVFLLNTLHMLNMLNCCFMISVLRIFWVHLKHGSVMCQSHGPPTLHDPTYWHEWHHLPFPSPSPTVSYRRTFSDRWNPNQHSSSLQLTSVPTTWTWEKNKQTKKHRHHHHTLDFVIIQTWLGG